MDKIKIWKHRLVVLAVLLMAAGASYCQTASVQWQYGYEEALKQAREAKKPVLLDFYASWCGPCRSMDTQVYTDPRIIKTLQDFVCIKIDIDQNQNLAFDYRIGSIPQSTVLNIHGDIIANKTGFIAADGFLRFLSSAKLLADKPIEEIDPAQLIGNVSAQPPKPTVKVELLNSKALLKLLADKDPENRQAARKEILSRNTPELRDALKKNLQATYLGTRIAALETLSELSKKNPSQDKEFDAILNEYDPWAKKETRKEMSRPNQLGPSQPRSGDSM